MPVVKIFRKLPLRSIVLLYFFNRIIFIKSLDSGQRFSFLKAIHNFENIAITNLKLRCFYYRA